MGAQSLSLYLNPLSLITNPESLILESLILESVESLRDSAMRRFSDEGFEDWRFKD